MVAPGLTKPLLIGNQARQGPPASWKLDRIAPSARAVNRSTWLARGTSVVTVAPGAILVSLWIADHELHFASGGGVGGGFGEWIADDELAPGADGAPIEGSPTVEGGGVCPTIVGDAARLMSGEGPGAPPLKKACLMARPPMPRARIVARATGSPVGM